MVRDPGLQMSLDVASPLSGQPVLGKVLPAALHHVIHAADVMHASPASDGMCHSSGLIIGKSMAAVDRSRRCDLYVYVCMYVCATPLTSPGTSCAHRPKHTQIIYLSTPAFM